MAERRLADLLPGEQCADRVVRDFLRSQGGRLECVVGRDGMVFAVRGTIRRRVLRQLLRCVEEQVGSAELVEVNPPEFRRWSEGARPRSAAEQAAAKKEANKTVEYVFGAAIERRASDVYLDIRREEAFLSFRTFGFRRPFEEPFSREAGLELARSIWALGQNAQFQEGGVCDVVFEFPHGGRNYRIRGNGVKEVRGNSVVCRVLDPEFIVPLRDAGYTAGQVSQIERICRSPGGLIMISGETNSGKSTTLAGLMADLPRTQKIVEIADPVERVMDHVTHIEVPRYGENVEQLTKEIMQCLVRQNPDTLVLGEVRDRVTAEMAREMGVEGKRVLSTVHTQSCAAAIPRLMHLGIPGWQLGTRQFLAGIVNQNLVPVVCPRCGLRRHSDRDIDERVRREFGSDAEIRFVNPNGCADCSGGVSGQTLVAEVYPLWLDRSGKAHELIAAAKLAELERYMREDGPAGGTLTKHAHAAQKIRAGEIDPVHTQRIIGEFGAEDLAAGRDKIVQFRG